MDFSLNMYKEICRALQAYKVITVEQYLLGKNQEPFVVLRHDVDRELGNALAMAELEHGFGINSTYYFRFPSTFDVNSLSRISGLGHEIGYHYEVLDKAKGDRTKAIAIFNRELETFRKHFPVTTVCMHGNPLTPWHGRSIWDSRDFQEFNLLGEGYLSFRAPLVYLTDTGRNWNGEHNVKDSFSAQASRLSVKNTSHLIDLLNGKELGSLYLNCHPERWGPGIWGWARAFVRDNSFNLGKTILKRVQ